MLTGLLIGRALLSPVLTGIVTGGVTMGLLWVYQQRRQRRGFTWWQYGFIVPVVLVGIWTWVPTAIMALWPPPRRRV